jgi:hypothetical protein
MWRDMCYQYFNNFTEMAIDMDYRKWVLNEDPNPFRTKLCSMIYSKYKEKFGVWPRSMIDEPAEPTPEVLSYVRSRFIAYTKSKKRI